MTQYNKTIPTDVNGQKTTAVPSDQTASPEWVTPVHIASTGLQMPTDVQNSVAYDTADDMFKMKSMQKKWKTDFGGTTLDTNKWTLVQTGAGATVSVGSGELTVATGVTINTETIIMSNETFTIPFKGMFGFYVSQKIANQEFYMEFVSVDPSTGLPDGKDLAAWRIAGGDSTTTTLGVYQVAANAITTQSSASSTINAVTSYSIAEIEMFEDEAWFHSRQMDSTNGRSNSYVKHQNIPNPSNVFKLRLRAKNLGTAPASTTNFKLQFVNVADYAELTAEITAGRGNVAAGQSIGVQVLNTPNVSVSNSRADWAVSTFPGGGVGNYDYARSQGNLEFAMNLRGRTPVKGMDLPTWQYVRPQPAAAGAGCATAIDCRGTNRYMYIIYSITSFWRYDTYTDTWQQLANPNALGGSGTWGAGTCMRFDPSKGTAGYVWLLNGYTTAAGWGYYDIAADTWTQKTLPATAWATDGQLVHTDPAFPTTAGLGNDDFIYLFGNNGTVVKKYQISTDAWTTLAASPAAIGAGNMAFWAYQQDADKIYVFRGAGSSTLYSYSISANTWATLTPKPATETFNTGSCGSYLADKNKYIFQKDNSHRLLALDLATNTIEPAGTVPYSGGTAVAGDGLFDIKTSDGSLFVYFRRHSATEMFRTMIHWM